MTDQPSEGIVHYRIIYRKKYDFLQRLADNVFFCGNHESGIFFLDRIIIMSNDSIIQLNRSSLYINFSLPHDIRNNKIVGCIKNMLLLK